MPVNRARTGKARRVLMAAAVAIGAAGSLSATGAAAAAPVTKHGYTFATLNDAADPTFNQLLGINASGAIAGYFGSGATGHPNRGYLLTAPYGQGSYVSENFPGSVQTQVTGLNNHGVTVGFYVDGTGANIGFWARNGHFHSVAFPAAKPASPRFQQLLGVNDNGIAVGFYTDSGNVNHGFSYDIKTGKFRAVLQPGAPGANLIATAINDHGDIAGLIEVTASSQEAFVSYGSGKFKTITVKGAVATQAFGISDTGEVVGDSTGTGLASTHGFTWTPKGGFVTVDDPNGVGNTTINGVNVRGDLVGFYIDPAGNTDGFLALRH